MQTIDECIEFVNKSPDENHEIDVEKTTDIPIFIIDGNNFDDMKSFYDECERGFNMQCSWGRNLDALVDILRGGFFHKDSNFILIWKNSDISKQRLGHKYRVKQLKEWLKGAHSSNHESINKRIIAAQNGEGETTFDQLCTILSRGCNDFRLE